MAPLKDSISWSITTSSGFAAPFAFTQRAKPDQIAGCALFSLEMREAGRGNEFIDQRKTDQ